MANPVGRPTIYNNEMLITAKAYYAEKKAKGEMPYIEELTQKLDITRQSLNQWVKGEVEGIDEEFIDTIKKIEELQKQLLMSGGLLEKYNTAMSIFLLKANHGMVETSRQEFTGKDGQPLINEGGMIVLFSKLLSKVLPNGKQNSGTNKKQTQLIEEGSEQHS